MRNDYSSKTADELRYIMRDAGEAATAMRGHDDRAEGRYLDQVAEARMELSRRERVQAKAARKPARYHVIIRAEDGRHAKRYTSLAGARDEAVRQLGGTLEDRYDFMHNDGGGTFTPLDLVKLDERETFALRFVDDWGRTVTLEKREHAGD
jgi:hypothetical protein